MQVIEKYYLYSKGDLGLTPREVEGRLESTFQMAQAWDCVLLLDEADIFLAQRSNADLERNALVSGILALVAHTLENPSTDQIPSISESIGVLRRHSLSHNQQSWRS